MSLDIGLSLKNEIEKTEITRREGITRKKITAKKIKFAKKNIIRSYKEPLEQGRQGDWG